VLVVVAVVPTVPIAPRKPPTPQDKAFAAAAARKRYLWVKDTDVINGGGKMLESILFSDLLPATKEPFVRSYVSGVDTRVTAVFFSSGVEITV